MDLNVPYISNNLHSSILVSRLYVLLNLDLCLVDPVTDVINLARSHNKIESLVKVTFGETDDMDRALAAVTQSMITGCWVILENCHLAARWSEEFLHQLEVDMGSKCVPYFFSGIITGDTLVSYWPIFFLSLVAVPEVFANHNSYFSQFPFRLKWRMM